MPPDVYPIFSISHSIRIFSIFQDIRKTQVPPEASYTRYSSYRAFWVWSRDRLRDIASAMVRPHRRRCILLFGNSDATHTHEHGDPARRYIFDSGHFSRSRTLSSHRIRRSRVRAGVHYIQAEHRVCRYTFRDPTSSFGSSHFGIHWWRRGE